VSVTETYSVKSLYDSRIMNWKGFGRNRRDILEVPVRNVLGGTKESHVRPLRTFVVPIWTVTVTAGCSVITSSTFAFKLCIWLSGNISGSGEVQKYP
jgi:hypothetical protein